MAEVIKIEGQHKLNGTVRINSAKNATVALIPASILASKGTMKLLSVPEIEDVDALSKLLEELGCEVGRDNDSLDIKVDGMKNIPLESKIVTKLRASYYFMGALLGKYKEVQIKMPGGCDLGPRPIDLHLKGFEALGADIKYKQGSYFLKAEKLTGAKIYLDFPSVGATVNIMLAAVYAQGRTTIDNCAKEPEIIDLASMLNKMGAIVRGAGTSMITIDGVNELVGTVHEIIPDRIVAGTYLIIAAAMAEKMTIENIIPHHLEALISKLQEMGVRMDIGLDAMTVYGGNDLQASDVQTRPYPGFATDLQQPLTTLLTMVHGQSSVWDTIYGERFKHCIELQRMGANFQVNQSRASINGPTKLFGDTVTATDLRAGASLVIAGLIAQGVTTIREVYHIDRGYEKIDENLRALGAKIWREEENN